MNEQEAFEVWFKSVAKYTQPQDTDAWMQEAWNAALAWLRSQGEPVATLHDDGYWTWKNRANAPHESNYAGWRMDVFAAPQPAIPDGWQPIETAPKDELILVGPTKRMGVCAAMNHSRDGWGTETPSEWVTIYTPTHWMPLPAAPEPSK